MSECVQPDSLELTILMPCLNESETLEICIRKAQEYLQSSGIAGEVLIADNGSIDGSQDIASRLGARVVNVPERGYGAALCGGIAAARGQYTIMGDADDSYDFAALQPFVEALRRGTQLVMGNRFAGGIDEGAMPFLHRYLGNPVLSFLGRLFFRIPVGDFHCGLRGFDTKTMRQLELSTSGMEFASEMVVKAALHKVSMVEVPTRLSKDGRSHPPHLRTWRDGWRHLCFLLTLTPHWLFIYPGLCLLLLGLLGICSMLGGPVHVLGLSLEIKSFIFSCLSMVLGVQSITLGVIIHEYAVSTQILPPRQSPWIWDWLTRDKLALVAAVFVIAGFLLALFCLGAWVFSGLGSLESGLFDRLTVLALTCIAAGVQIFHSAFVYEILITKTRQQREA